MRHTHLLLLPVIAGGIFATSQAQSCVPDNTNTTISVKSKKIRCSESLDSSGCNVQRNTVKIEVESSCKAEESVDVTCTAAYNLITGKFPEGTERKVTTTERVELENGEGDAKLYFTINSLTDPIRKSSVTGVECRVAGSEPLMPEIPAAAPVEPMAPVKPMEPMKPAQPAAAPSLLPQPETREIVIQSAPQAPKAAEAKSDKALDLEILKEQNRARELDIKALELKIKLKEMER